MINSNHDIKYDIKAGYERERDRFKEVLDSYTLCVSLNDIEGIFRDQKKLISLFTNCYFGVEYDADISI
jgi:hypothetical protein